jgi:hypothetical protein
MPEIDPKTGQNIHDMTCRNRNCDGKKVLEARGAPGVHRYQCMKCHFSWGVPTGGGVDLG